MHTCNAIVKIKLQSYKFIFMIFRQKEFSYFGRVGRVRSHSDKVIFMSSQFFDVRPIKFDLCNNIGTINIKYYVCVRIYLA